MRSLNNDEKKQVLGGVLANELKAIKLYVQEVPKIKQKVDSFKADIKQVKSVIKVIKAAVTDISRQQTHHEHRLSRLEAA